VELCKRGVYYNHAAAVDTGSSALLTMALAPSAWPKSCLHVGLAGDARLRAFRHELGLPEFAMFWKDDAILRFFMGQQRNVAAFVCGQVYLCLFCASIRPLLTLVHTYLHTSASAAGRRVADRMHAHLMTFCQHPRLGFLGRNLPPAALVAQAPDAVSPLTEVHQAILEALLNRGTANAFQEWRDDMQQYCAHVLERPPHTGGHGITPMQESSMAGFYSATARFISWLAKLEHKDNWLPDKTSRIPPRGQTRASSRSNKCTRSLSHSTVFANGLPRHQRREMREPQLLRLRTMWPTQATQLPPLAPALRRPLRPPQRPMRKERSMCKTANQATLTTHPPAPSFPVLC